MPHAKGQWSKTYAQLRIAYSGLSSQVWKPEFWEK